MAFQAAAATLHEDLAVVSGGHLRTGNTMQVETKVVDNIKFFKVDLSIVRGDERKTIHDDVELFGGRFHFFRPSHKMLYFIVCQS